MLINTTPFYVGGVLISPTEYVPDLSSNVFDPNVDYVVAMSNYTVPSPLVAVASSEINATYPAWKAFNNLLYPINTGSTTERWASGGQPSGGSPQWLKIDLGSGAVITDYSIRYNVAAGQSPRDWEFQGSNNDVDWTTLDTQVGIEEASYSTQIINNITTPASYQYYRLYITANNGSATAVSVDELELFTERLPTLEASASSVYSGTYPAWKAFNNLIYPINTASDINRWASVGGLPQWLKIDLGIGESVKIGRYRLYFAVVAGSDQAPKDWELQGSNNNADWTTLDSQSGVLWAEWNAGAITHDISAPDFFRYYRLYITANNGSAVATSVDEFELFEVL